LTRVATAWLALMCSGWALAQQIPTDPSDDAGASFDEDRPQTPAPYQPTTQPQSYDQNKPPWQWDHLSDDWFGLRPRLEDRGIAFDANLTADWAKNFTGGLNTTGTNYGELFSTSFTLDTNRLIGLPGGTLFIDFQNVNGNFASADVGDIQNVDSIYSNSRTQLGELWYEQFFLDNKLHVRVGKIDVAGEFNLTSDANNFVHSGMTQTLNILAFPTYPDPSSGGDIFVEPCEHFYAGVGIFDGALQDGIQTGKLGPATLFGSPGDLFYIAETGLKWNLQKNLPGVIGVGGWHDTARFDRFNGGSDRGTSGIYLVADQMLYREHSGTNDPQGLGIFLRYGWADPHVSPIEHHIAGGLSWMGLFPKRDADVLGIGTSCAILSRDRGAGFDDRAEAAIETFYKIQITPYFSVQPDVQYVINPGGIASRDNAVFAMLRMSVDF
jgi:porin